MVATQSKQLNRQNFNFAEFMEVVKMRVYYKGMNKNYNYRIAEINLKK